MRRSPILTPTTLWVELANTGKRMAGPGASCPFLIRFPMSLKGQCPRCKAPLDVAVAVVLADSRDGVVGRACRGTTPSTVISAGGVLDRGPDIAAVVQSADMQAASIDASVPAEREVADDEA